MKSKEFSHPSRSSELPGLLYETVEPGPNGAPLWGVGVAPISYKEPDSSPGLRDDRA